MLAATNFTGLSNVYVMKKGNCTLGAQLLTVAAQTTFSGASANASKLFFGHGAGFSSVPLNSTTNAASFDQTSAVSYNSSSGTPTALGPPAVALGSSAIPENPIFSGGDRKVRSTHHAPTCTPAQSCWQDVWSPTPSSSANLNGGAAAFGSGTPVFDGSSIYVTDGKGIVYSFSQVTGLWQGQVPPVSTSSW